MQLVYALQPAVSLVPESTLENHTIFTSFLF